MPAYIRLLAYFSNFILLASFLGIGVGCLLAPVTRAGCSSGSRCCRPTVILAVYYFRLEVSVPTAGSIYFSSGTAEKVVLVESTMLLPLLFVIVAALFATMAQRMGREMASMPPLRGYTINILGSLAGVAAFAVISWLQLSPVWWFGARVRSRAAAADVGRAVEPGAASDGRSTRPPAVAGASCSASRSSSCTSWPAARSGRRTTKSPSGRKDRTPSSR